MSSLPEGQTVRVAIVLDKAVQEVLGTAWGCVPGPAAAAAQLTGSCVRSIVPLSIAGVAHELQLLAEAAAVAALLPRMLGRAAAAAEEAALGGDLCAELANQVAGRLAGLLGERGMHVDLGTPVTPASASEPFNSPTSVGETSASPAAAPVPIFGFSWVCSGHRLELSLSRTASVPA